MKRIRFSSHLLACALVLALLLALLPPGIARADAPVPVLDQSFVSPADTSAEINGPTRYVAQTFTAGLTGALTAVSLDVQSTSAFALKLRVQDVTDGLPNATILSDVYVWGPNFTVLSAAPLTLLIDVGTVYVQAGHQYALVVQYDGAGSPGHAEGSWLGASGDAYPAGGAFQTNDETFTDWTPLALDLHFKTYVVPNVPVHDLSVTYDGGAKHAKGCQVFDEYVTVRNDGPDTASNVVLAIHITDQFDLVSIEALDGQAWPAAQLAPGESRELKVTLKATAFVPGESRDGRWNATVGTEVWPAIELDPNAANDAYFGAVRLVGKSRMVCP